MPQTRNVSNAQQLAAALAAASGGDTIVLASGSYGDLDLTGVSFASNVTLVSQVPLGARFSSVELVDTDHLVFDGVTVAGEFRAWKASDSISLLNSDVNGSAYFTEASNILVQGNDITGGMNALVFNRVQHAKVLYNSLHDARSDILRVTGDSDYIDIIGNHLVDVHPQNGDHPDLIQMFAQYGHTPNNIRIIDNWLYDDPKTGNNEPGQGVFLGDPGTGGFRHILIEGNVVNVGSANGIYVNGGIEDYVVRDNVLGVWPNGSGGTIRIVERHDVSNRGTTIEGNTARRIMDETTSLSNGLKIIDNTIKIVQGGPPTGSPGDGVSPPPSPPPSPPVSPPPPPPSTPGELHVSNAQELAAALASAVAGDTIVLGSGDYGALDLDNLAFAGGVTIKAATALGARFSNIELTNVDHLAFDGIAVAGAFRVLTGSEGVSLLNSDVDGTASFLRASDIYLKGNYISGEVNALIFNHTSHVKVIGNTIHDVRSDLVRVVGDSHDVRIAYNHLLDVVATDEDHPDMIQVIGSGEDTPSNVRIVGNIMYDDPATGGIEPAQGVFISNPLNDGHHNVLVADNLIAVGSPNSIYLNGGVHNVLVTGNVLAVWPDGQGDGGVVRFSEKSNIPNTGVRVEHNLIRDIRQETDLSVDPKIGENTFKTIPFAELLANWDAHVDASFAAVPHGVTLDDLVA